jgi:hypothetical protein
MLSRIAGGWYHREIAAATSGIERQAGQAGSDGVQAESAAEKWVEFQGLEQRAAESPRALPRIT